MEHKKIFIQLQIMGKRFRFCATLIQYIFFDIPIRYNRTE